MKSCAKKCPASPVMAIFVRSLKNQNASCEFPWNEFLGRSIEFWITTAHNRHDYGMTSGSERAGLGVRWQAQRDTVLDSNMPITEALS